MKPKPQLRKPSKASENGATVIIIIVTAIIVVVIAVNVIHFLEIVKL
jgi:hypothetical protein